VSQPRRPRIGIVGAGRRRQGLGPFVARDLAAAGAEIAGFVVTSAASRDAVTHAWSRELGIQARGHLDFSSLLRSERLDAVAILSPAETHERYLEAALEAGLHVLCEKPFVWGRPELAATARRLALGFEKRGLLLWENCQWPYTLPAFERLHPGALAQPPRRLAVRLQPGSTGAQMLGDAVPHALSLIQALLPGGAGQIERLRFKGGRQTSRRLALEFRYRAGERELEVAIELLRSDRRPREACLEIDGRRAERLVAADGYQLSFAEGGRTVPLPDPLTLLVADFVSALRLASEARSEAEPSGGGGAGYARAVTARIAERMELLERIVTGFAQQVRGEGAP
jgi:Oxidoreductase family, NAD-binding Rossmann fold